MMFVYGDSWRFSEKSRGATGCRRNRGTNRNCNGGDGRSTRFGQIPFGRGVVRRQPCLPHHQHHSPIGGYGVYGPWRLLDMGFMGPYGLMVLSWCSSGAHGRPIACCDGLAVKTSWERCRHDGDIKPPGMPMSSCASD